MSRGGLITRRMVVGPAETPALRFCISGNDLGILSFARRSMGRSARASVAATDRRLRAFREFYLNKLLAAAAGLAAFTRLCFTAGFRFAIASAFFRRHDVLSYSLRFRLSQPTPVAEWPPCCGSTDKSSRGPLCRTSLCRVQQGP